MQNCIATVADLGHKETCMSREEYEVLYKVPDSTFFAICYLTIRTSYVNLFNMF